MTRAALLAWWVVIVGSVSLSLALGRAGAQIIWVLVQPWVMALARAIHGGA